MSARGLPRRSLLAGSLVLPAFCVRAQSAPLLSAREAFEGVRAGRLLLVDIRTAEEQADTGLPQGSVALGAAASGFEIRLAALRLDHAGRRLALIDRAGGQAPALRDKLAARGWRDLAAVRGGMLGPEGWLAQGLPVARPPE